MSAAIAQFRHAAFSASRVARSRPTEANGSRLTSNRSGSWRCFGVEFYLPILRHTNSGGQL
jgi:hypothetical protein